MRPAGVDRRYVWLVCKMWLYFQGQTHPESVLILSSNRVPPPTHALIPRQGISPENVGRAGSGTGALVCSVFVSSNLSSFWSGIRFATEAPAALYA